MTEQPLHNLIDRAVHDAEAVDREVRRQGEAKYFDDLASFGWIRIARDIILAGGAYPVWLIACVTAVGAVSSIYRNIDSWPQLFTAFFPMAMAVGAAALAAGVIGMIWAGFVTVFTLPVMHLLVWSLNLRLRWTMLGAFAGGLVGFLAILPLTMQIPSWVKPGELFAPLVAACLGPGLATIAGQIGGARGGSTAEFQLRAKMASRRALIELGWKEPTAAKSDEEESLAEADRSHFRFRTIHLLLLGVWVSLLLSLIRVAGIPYELILPLLLAWLVYQAATLAAGRFIATRLGPWWRGER